MRFDLSAVRTPNPITAVATVGISLKAGEEGDFPWQRAIAIAVWHKVAELDRASGYAPWTVCAPVCESEDEVGRAVWSFRIEVPISPEAARPRELLRAVEIMRSVLR